MEYKIIRTKRKTTSMEITRDGKIVIRAPLKYTDAQAEAFFNREKEWIQKRLPAIMAKKQLYEGLSAESIRLLREKAKQYIIPLCEQYAQIIGVTPSKISINSAKARFGSCSADKSIRFSLYLMLYPKKAIEYVVVHELAHILQPNHSRAFHAEVQKIFPDERERERLLRPENASIENYNESVIAFESNGIV